MLGYEVGEQVARSQSRFPSRAIGRGRDARPSEHVKAWVREKEPRQVKVKTFPPGPSIRADVVWSVNSTSIKRKTHMVVLAY